MLFEQYFSGKKNLKDVQVFPVTDDMTIYLPENNLPIIPSYKIRGKERVVGFCGYYATFDGRIKAIYRTTDELLRMADRFSNNFSYLVYVNLRDGKYTEEEKEQLYQRSPWYDPTLRYTLCVKMMYRILGSFYSGREGQQI